MSKNVYNLSYVSFWDVIHVFACLSTILTTFQAKLKATTSLVASIVRSMQLRKKTA